MRIAFLDVDTQYDFMDPAGALHVRGAEALGPNLKRLTEYALARRIPVLASADALPPPRRGGSEVPDMQPRT